MAKVYKLVDQPGTSNVLCLTTNWNKCVLCQEDTPELLRCPASSKRDAEGYKTIADNIKVGCLPKTINLSRLDDGVGIVEPSESTKPNGMTLIDYNSTRQNLSEQRRGILALKTIQLLPRSSPVGL